MTTGAEIDILPDPVAGRIFRVVRANTTNLRDAVSGGPGGRPARAVLTTPGRGRIMRPRPEGPMVTAPALLLAVLGALRAEQLGR